MLPIVIVACLATVAMCAPTDLRPTTVLSEGPEGRLQETEEPGKGYWGYITTQTADGQFEHKTIDGKTIATTVKQLPVSPAVLPAVYPYPMSFVPGYGFRYFPGNNFPAYYPFYPGQYGFPGNQETKSDVEEPSDDVTVEQLLAVDEDGTRQSPPTPNTNPLSPIFNFMIGWNNLNIAALTAANVGMFLIG